MTQVEQGLVCWLAPSWAGYQIQRSTDCLVVLTWAALCRSVFVGLGELEQTFVHLVLENKVVGFVGQYEGVFFPVKKKAAS